MPMPPNCTTISTIATIVLILQSMPGGVPIKKLVPFVARVLDRKNFCAGNLAAILDTAETHLGVFVWKDDHNIGLSWIAAPAGKQPYVIATRKPAA